MRNRGLIVMALAMALTGSSGNIGLAQHEDKPHLRTHVLVNLEAGASEGEVLGSSSSRFADRWFRVPVPNGLDPIGWVHELSVRQGVATAELDLLFAPLATPPFKANDPLYTTGEDNPSAQWHLHAVDVAGAWQASVGAGVLVAVLDTGVSNGPDGFCHPLASEYDAVTEISGPGSAADESGHGSHIAGSIAQCSGNAMGGAGMATESRIIPVDVFDGDRASVSDVVQGIDWAISHGAHVINLSLGGLGLESEALDAAIERAVDANILVVAAAGNEPGAVFYPANHPKVMAVGASNINNEVTAYSARGSGLDLLAPGGDGSGPIWQEIGGSYQPLTGTSMATAQVSGAAALLRAKFPTATWEQVRNSMNCSAKDLGPAGWDSSTGHGLLDADDALSDLNLMVALGTAACVDPPPQDGSRIGAVESATGIWRLFDGGLKTHTFYYGNPGDFPFYGDWDCDGVDTPGLYRQSDGFAYLRNANTQGVADISFFFGNPGDIAIAGDFNGDGCDTVSIYRPSEARFYIINTLGGGDAGLGDAEYSYLFGVSGDDPFVGDWNGDGIDTPGLRRSSNGFVYLRNTNTQGVADIDYFYGISGDIVFVGDWNADGVDTLGLYRPSNGIVHLRNTNTTGGADYQFSVGTGMYPVAGER